MQVRFPGFDFSTSTPAWGENREAVVIINAGAIIPPAIERYMIRVMRRARAALDAVADADLIADVDVFNKQEGQHHKLHAAYLHMIRDGGYPRIMEFEAAFIADLERFLADESLAWNLSYCEGFESSGAAMAEAFVDGQVQQLCGDHGSVPMQLWMWHLAEEFEHRSVVHDVLHRLYGPEKAFALRTAGADFNRKHLAEHTAVAAAYLYEVDRTRMSESEVDASVAREHAAWIGMGEAFGARLNWVYEPGYTPAAIAPPRDYDAILARYSPRVTNMEAGTDAATVVAQWNLAPHPEGGFFRETYRSALAITPPAWPGPRAFATAILFLLRAHERSARHRVRGDELWMWHAGAPMALAIEGVTHLVGPDPSAGHALHVLVPAGAWQSATPATPTNRTSGTWSLVACVVAPGFDFADFEMDAR